MVARKKPTPYSKLSPSAKKKAKPASYKGRVGGRAGVRTGRRPLG